MCAIAMRAPRHDRYLRRVLRDSGFAVPRTVAGVFTLPAGVVEGLACEGTLRTLYVRDVDGARRVLRRVGVMCDRCSAILPDGRRDEP
jgi:hypothetical protein